MNTSESSFNAPRVVVAGLAGDSGKTVVTVGLLLAARKRGLAVRAFKKGPDYIDAAWLRWATGQPARNLDTFLMGAEGACAHFAEHAICDGLNVIEGNRGLFDGVDVEGTHSTAMLARKLGAPVLLVVDATKVTRTAAALVLGCQKMDPEVHIAGVILNRVAGARHESIARAAIESTCGVPVVGVLPRIAGEELIPSRHLGLVPPQEMKSELVSHDATKREVDADFISRHVADAVGNNLDFERIEKIAQAAAAFACLRPVSQQRDELSPASAMQPAPGADIGPVRIAYVKDCAFSFYYPENLEALERAGATLVPVSSMADTALPSGIDALYIGGGFPETHGPRIAANSAFLASLNAAAEAGLPIYAECGGLMLLARGIKWHDTYSPMSAVFPFDVEVCARPQGHGYTTIAVDRENAFFALGTVLRGHEFHYSKVIGAPARYASACSVQRGTGVGGGRDAFVVNNVWASYTHVHATGTPEWAESVVGGAQRYRCAFI